MRHKLLSLSAAILAGALSLIAVHAYAQESPSGRTCIQPLERGDPFQSETNPSRLSAIASECGRVALAERGVRSARAHFYSGRAYGATSNVLEATRHLLIAVNAGPLFGAEFEREQ